MWITHPKGVETNQETLLYGEFEDYFGDKFYNIIALNQGTLLNDREYIVPETGTYRITFYHYVCVDNQVVCLALPLYLNYNFLNITGLVHPEDPTTFNVQLNAGDVLGFHFTPLTPPDHNTNENGYLKIEKYNTAISFSEELKNLKITDFFKEILNRFALTIFIDKDNNYIFKTFNERLQSGVIDWTDKHKERTSETYTPKNYAQVNYFKHKYNDENANYNNGNFLIDNKNLKDNTDILSSFTYSPEKDIESFFINNSFNENIFPTLLWEKEVSENTGTQTIKYKSLSNRFYFLRLENITQNSILRSETLLVEQAITSFPAARFYMTLYKDFVPKYYSNIRLLLNDFRLHKMQINLSCIDIHNLDYDKIYYFYQEKNYYFINKINYENGKISNVEMYRVKYSEQ